MSSYFRSSFVSWKTSNSLSNPSVYGNSCDTSSFGYNPKYPSLNNSHGTSSHYQQQQYVPSQEEYNPACPSYSKPVFTRDSLHPYQKSRALFSQYRVNHHHSTKNKPYSTKLKGRQLQKESFTRKKVCGRLTASESSSVNFRACKAEDAPHSDDQKPGRIRTASPDKPDISVLKIISPKNNAKHWRKLQAGSSDAVTRKGQSSSSGVRKNMSYMPFGSGMPRGGYTVIRGGRSGRSGGRRYVVKPNNNPMDIPFAPLPDDAPAISLSIDPDNFICFHGFSSIFTTQHPFPVLIDGKIYESGDHYYQIQKIHDLCGTVSDRLTETVRDEKGRRLDGKVGFNERRDKSFSQIAKDVIRLNNVDKKKVDEWRYSKGLEIMQKALLAKVSQSAMLRQALAESGSKILVHAFPGDCIYGAGCRHAQVKRWCESMKANGASTIRIPATFPLTTESVVSCPNFAQGRNVLGVILMQLREMLHENKVPIVDLGSVFDSLRMGSNNVDATIDDQDCGEGFAIGGGSIQAKIGGGTTKA